MQPTPTSRLLVTTALAALAAPAVAQCTNTWEPGYGCPGVNGQVDAMTRWDPDGAGPAAEQIALVGPFTIAGRIGVQGFATWSLQTRTFAVPPPPPGCDVVDGRLNIHSMATTVQGELVVSYRASHCGRVAKWNGGQWARLGGDFESAATSLLLHGNGDLFAAGSFGRVGTVVAPGIARWNGTAWEPIGTGFACRGTALASGPGGELLVAGSVGIGTPTLLPGVARWNGAAWSMVGNALTGTQPLPVAVASAGGQRYVATSGGILLRLVGGSWLQVPGAPNRCAKLWPSASGKLLVIGSNVGYVVGGGAVEHPWFGTLAPTTGAWTARAGSTLEPFLPTRYTSIVELAGGAFVIGGRTTEFANVALWTGSRWDALGDGPGDGVRCAVAIDDEQFYVGGTFETVGGKRANGVARWDGSTWHRLGRGLEGDVADLALLPNGDLVAGGWIVMSGASGLTFGLARWNGTRWTDFGSVTAGTSPWAVRSLHRRPNGDLVVGGLFTDASGVPCSNVASWNGSNWSNLSGGVADEVIAIAEGPTGNLLLATSHQVLEHQGGTTWVSRLSTTDRLTDLAVLPDGRLVTTGTEQTLLLGSYLVDRAVIQVGSVRYVEQNDSKATNLTTLPGGDLLAFGRFFLLSSGTSTVVCPTSCVRIPADAASPLVAGPDVTDLVDADAFPNGDLLLVARPRRPGQDVWQVGRLSTTCPAVAASTGSGCAANALVATSLPWLGATTRATATGLPANSFAIDVLGLGSVSLPLASLLPIGQPGCDLLVSPDLFGVQLATTGQVEVALALPNDPMLVGAVLHRQVLALAANAAGVPNALTSTNALRLTIGAF